MRDESLAFSCSYVETFSTRRRSLSPRDTLRESSSPVSEFPPFYDKRTVILGMLLLRRRSVHLPNVTTLQTTNRVDGVMACLRERQEQEVEFPKATSKRRH